MNYQSDSLGSKYLKNFLENEIIFQKMAADFRTQEDMDSRKSSYISNMSDMRRMSVISLGFGAEKDEEEEKKVERDRKGTHQQAANDSFLSQEGNSK